MNHALFSTGKNDWETPPEFFAALDAEFHFTLDACATSDNAKCARYYTPDENGLSQNWSKETVWCNPPYSAGEQDRWIKKCWEEGQKPETEVVALLPARTDAKRFYRYILGQAEIRFVPGRIKFVGAKYNAPFPCMIVIWRGPQGAGE